MYFKKAYCTVNVHTNAPKKIIISLYNLKVPFITIQAHCWSFISGQKYAHAISNEIFFLEMSRPLHELPKLPSPESKKGSSELYLERAEIKPYTWSRAIHEPPRHQLYHQTMVALDSTKGESVGNLGSTTEHTQPIMRYGSWRVWCHQRVGHCSNTIWNTPGPSSPKQ